MIQKIYDDYFNLLLQGHRQACLRIVKELVAQGTPLKPIYLELFERSLYQVGELWETNRISVAVEHVATAITENAMGLLHPVIFGSEHCGRKAIVSCVANEFHQIGGKMVADFFELHGWHGYFLGANTPIKDLLQMVEDKKPDMVCFSLTLFANLSDLLGYIRALTDAFPQVRVLAGGQAFCWGSSDVFDSCSRTQFVATLDDLENIITQYSRET